MVECTNELMSQAKNQTDIDWVCMHCKDNLTCPLLNCDPYADNFPVENWSFLPVENKKMKNNV